MNPTPHGWRILTREKMGDFNPRNDTLNNLTSLHPPITVIKMPIIKAAIFHRLHKSMPIHKRTTAIVKQKGR
jgi:hypothetical protein